MADMSSKVYQSGEPTPTSGLYELVGTGQAAIVRKLQAGQVFPYHDGREVCWYLRYGETRPDGSRWSPNQTLSEIRD